MNQNLHPKTKEFLESVVKGTESSSIFYAYLSTNDDEIKKYITNINNAYVANLPESPDDTNKSDLVYYVGKKISELASRIDPKYAGLVKVELNMNPIEEYLKDKDVNAMSDYELDRIPSQYRLIINKNLKKAIIQLYSSENYIEGILKRYEKDDNALYNKINAIKKRMKPNDDKFEELSAIFIDFKASLEDSLLRILFSRLLNEGLSVEMPLPLKRLISMYNELFNEQGISKSGVCVSVSVRRMRNILHMNLVNFEGFRDFCEVVNDQVFKNQFQLSIEDEADMIFVYTSLMVKVFHDDMESNFKSVFIENCTLYLINRYILNKGKHRYENMYSIIEPILEKSPYTTKFRAEIIKTLATEYGVYSYDIVEISKSMKDKIIEKLKKRGISSDVMAEISNEISIGFSLKDEIIEKLKKHNVPSDVMAKISNDKGDDVFEALERHGVPLDVRYEIGNDFTNEFYDDKRNDIFRTLEKHNVPSEVRYEICEDYSNYVNKKIIVLVKDILRRRYNYSEVMNIFDEDEDITFHKDKLFVSDNDVEKIRKLQKKIEKAKDKNDKKTAKEKLEKLKDKYVKKEKINKLFHNVVFGEFIGSFMNGFDKTTNLYINQICRILSSRDLNGVYKLYLPGTSNPYYHMLSSISVALNWHQFIDFTPYKQYVNDMVVMLKDVEDELNYIKFDEDELKEEEVDEVNFRDAAALIRYTMDDGYDSLEEIFINKRLDRDKDSRTFIKNLYKLFTKMVDVMRRGGMRTLSTNEKKVLTIIHKNSHSVDFDTPTQSRKAIRMFIIDMMYILNMNHAVVEKVKSIDMKPGLIVPSRTSITSYNMSDSNPDEFEYSGHAILLYYNGDGVMHISDPNFIIAVNQPTFSYIYTKPKEINELADVFRIDSLREAVGEAMILGGRDGDGWKWLRRFAVIMMVMVMMVMVIVVIIRQLKSDGKSSRQLNVSEKSSVIL